MSYQIAFSKTAFDEYSNWASENPQTFVRIRSLIEAISRDPFRGIGKPEPLKHDLKGYWSRRVTDEHRLVYRVEAERILIISCKGHY
jgi:toxin YoeB